MARLSSPFPESFLRTLPCNRPRNRAHWRHWTRTSSFSADHRFARGIVVSVPSLKRGGKIFVQRRRFAPDTARNCGCLQSAPPKFFCLPVWEAAFVSPEIRDGLGQRALLRNNCD